jgi:hypothetical protein
MKKVDQLLDERFKSQRKCSVTHWSGLPQLAWVSVRPALIQSGTYKYTPYIQSAMRTTPRVVEFIPGKAQDDETDLENLEN